MAPAHGGRHRGKPAAGPAPMTGHNGAMIAGLQIRDAVASDVGELARLRALMDIEEGVAEPTGFRKEFARWFERHGHRFRICVASSGDRLVGTVWLERVERVPRPAEGRPCALGYVTFTFVERGHRNQGVGAAMLERLRAVALTEGYVALIVWPSDRSIPLYRRSGFASSHELLEHRLPA